MELSAYGNSLLACCPQPKSYYLLLIGESNPKWNSDRRHYANQKKIEKVRIEKIKDKTTIYTLKLTKQQYLHFMESKDRVHTISLGLTSAANEDCISPKD